MWKNVNPSNIRCRDSNPRPFEHESSPITTRPLSFLIGWNFLSSKSECLKWSLHKLFYRAGQGTQPYKPNLYYADCKRSNWSLLNLIEIRVLKNKSVGPINLQADFITIMIGLLQILYLLLCYYLLREYLLQNFMNFLLLIISRNPWKPSVPVNMSL